MRKVLILLSVTFACVPLVAQRGAPVVQRGTARLSTVAMIDLPGRPSFEAIAFAGNYIVVSQTNANTIDVFDPQKRRLVAQVTNIAQPRGIAVDAANNRFYVATANSTVAVISTQDWEVKDSFHVDGSPDIVALSRDGLRLYIGDKDNSTVSAVDTSLRRTVGTTQLSGRPEAIVEGENKAVFVSIQDQALVVGIDPQMKIVSQYRLQASQPAGLVYDPASRRLYVAVRAAVLALNADNGTEIGRVAAPRGISSLALDAPSHTLFGAGGGSVIALSTNGGLTAVDELPAEVKGHTLVYDASRKLLFLPGGREGTSKMLIVKDLNGTPQASSESEASLH